MGRVSGPARGAGEQPQGQGAGRTVGDRHADSVVDAGRLVEAVWRGLPRQQALQGVYGVRAKVPGRQVLTD